MSIDTKHNHHHHHPLSPRPPPALRASEAHGRGGVLATAPALSVASAELGDPRGAAGPLVSGRTLKARWQRGARASTYCFETAGGAAFEYTLENANELQDFAALDELLKVCEGGKVREGGKLRCGGKVRRWEGSGRWKLRCGGGGGVWEVAVR